MNPINRSGGSRMKKKRKLKKGKQILTAEALLRVCNTTTNNNDTTTGTRAAATTQSRMKKKTKKMKGQKILTIATRAVEKSLEQEKGNEICNHNYYGSPTNYNMDDPNDSICDIDLCHYTILPIAKVLKLEEEEKEGCIDKRKRKMYHNEITSYDDDDDDLFDVNDHGDEDVDDDDLFDVNDHGDNNNEYNDNNNVTNSKNLELGDNEDKINNDAFEEDTKDTNENETLGDDDVSLDLGYGSDIANDDEESTEPFKPAATHYGQRDKRKHCEAISDNLYGAYCSVLASSLLKLNDDDDEGMIFNLLYGRCVVQIITKARYTHNYSSLILYLSLSLSLVLFHTRICR
jgi:hypothetical protein